MTVDMFLVYVMLYASLYFEVFLLLSFISERKPTGQKDGVKYDELPKVSITVPCYNEEKTLAGTLDSLLSLEYPREKLEINVVNDGSQDATHKIAHNYAERFLQVHAFDKKNGGKASAMNLALRHSTGDLIGCLDADSFVDKDALNQIVRSFTSDKDVSAVTPAIIVSKPQNILQYMQRAEYMVGIFMRKAFGLIDSIVVTPGPFSIFRTDVVKQLGGWNHAHGTEDFEMGLRLQKNGYKIANNPLATVYTISPDTLYKLYKQRIRWVYGFLMNVWDYKSMFGNPKYGNVGIFVLPMAVFSVFGAVYLFFMTIYKIISSVYEFIIHVYTVGIHLTLPSFDMFYVNTSALTFLLIVLFAIILIIMNISAKISGLKLSIKHALIYFAIYGLVAPLWLTSALARATVGAEAKWRVLR